MIKNILLIASIIILLISYMRIILTYLTSKNKKVEEITGFDLAKEITSNYDEINIVQSKEISISKYNLKRKVIRLTKKNYESSDIFTLAITSCLSGYSLVNINKDKYLNLLSTIFTNIDYLNKSSLIALIISMLTTNIGDAKIVLILLGIILIYQYFIIQINHSSNEYIKEPLKKIISSKDINKIRNIHQTFVSLHTISFITTLILILRTILFILNF